MSNISDSEIKKALADHNGSKRAAAFALGMNRSTLQNRILRMDSNLLHGVNIPDMPESDETVDEILSRKRNLFERKKNAHDFNKLINISVTQNKPIAVTLIGDPHIDDDGCDIVGLESDLKTIASTDGMYAGHLGDLTNNWVGRLARLYANQTTTAKQAIMLMEWMLNAAPNLFVVGGNHDCWNQGMDLIGFVMRQHKSVVSAHGVRIALNFPNNKQIRINVRHDFKGHSQYNPNHGHRREQLWGGAKDHVYVSGHRHSDAASVIPQTDGTCSWSFMVSGYKVIDEYATEHGFQESKMAASVTVVINPNATNQAELVKPFWDVQAAAEYLNFVRNQ